MTESTAVQLPVGKDQKNRSRQIQALGPVI
jgi:hypothetical protein